MTLCVLTGCTHVYILGLHLQGDGAVAIVLHIGSHQIISHQAAGLQGLALAIPLVRIQLRISVGGGNQTVQTGLVNGLYDTGNHAIDGLVHAAVNGNVMYIQILFAKHLVVGLGLAFIVLILGGQGLGVVVSLLVIIGNSGHILKLNAAVSTGLELLDHGLIIICLAGSSVFLTLGLPAAVLHLIDCLDRAVGHIVDLCTTGKAANDQCNCQHQTEALECVFLHTYSFPFQKSKSVLQKRTYKIYIKFTKKSSPIYKISV